MKFQLWGWILFLVCAGFFIASSIRSGDMLSLIGSVIFLVACVVFIIPLVVRRSNGGER
jgi:hypothetical protein